MNDFSPWDIANSFRLHEAACLIAGVMPVSKRVPDREELPAPAIPIYVKLGSAYVLNWVSYHNDLHDDPKYPALKGCDEIPTLPELEPLKKLTGEFVTRGELHRWVKAMGIKSAYSFAPATTSPGAEQDTTPAQTETAPASGTSATGYAAYVTAKTASPLEQVPTVEPYSVEKMPPVPRVGPASNGPVPAKPNWRHLIQAEAREHWLRLRASGCNPSVYSICGDMAKWCADNKIKGDKGQDPKAGTIRNTVLGGGNWTPPHHSVAEAKNYIAQIAQTKAAQTAQ